jgi:hypothetical protein
MTSDHIVAKIVLDIIVTFDTIFAFVSPLVVFLTSLPVMWRKEHLWKFSVFQKVHLSSPVC